MGTVIILCVFLIYVQEAKTSLKKNGGSKLGVQTRATSSEKMSRLLLFGCVLDNIHPMITSVFPKLFITSLVLFSTVNYQFTKIAAISLTEYTNPSLNTIF